MLFFSSHKRPYRISSHPDVNSKIHLPHLLVYPSKRDIESGRDGRLERETLPLPMCKPLANGRVEDGMITYAARRWLKGCRRILSI
jgi:hypothetical protein